MKYIWWKIKLMSKIKQITIYECLYLKDSISLFPTNACSDHMRLVMRMALTVYRASIWVTFLVFLLEPSFFNQDGLTALWYNPQKWSSFLVQVVNADTSHWLFSLWLGELVFNVLSSTILRNLQSHCWVLNNPDTKQGTKNTEFPGGVLGASLEATGPVPLTSYWPGAQAHDHPQLQGSLGNVVSGCLVQARGVVSVTHCLPCSPLVLIAYILLLKCTVLHKWHQFHFNFWEKIMIVHIHHT